MQNWWNTLSTQTTVQLVSIVLVAALLNVSCTGINRSSSTEMPADSILPVEDSSQLPQVISKLIQTADQQYRQGSYNDSLSTLERAVRIKPRHPEVWSRMAQIYALQGQHKQAIQHAERSNGYIKANSALKEFNDTLIQFSNEGVTP